MATTPPALTTDTSIQLEYATTPENWKPTMADAFTYEFVLDTSVAQGGARSLFGISSPAVQNAAVPTGVHVWYVGGQINLKLTGYGVSFGDREVNTTGMVVGPKYHIIISGDGVGNGFSIYVDGVLDVHTGNGDTSLIYRTPGDYTLRIGKGVHWTIAVVPGTSGMGLSALRYYDRTLTLQERENNYNSLLGEVACDSSAAAGIVFSFPLQTDTVDVISSISPDVALGTILFNSTGLPTSCDCTILGDPARYVSEDETTTGTRLLTDDEYRLFIKARIAKNQSKGNINSLVDLILFIVNSTGFILFDGPGVAEFTVGFDVGTLSANDKVFISQSDLLPKPAGVKLNLFEYPANGAFGYVGAPGDIAGYDVGQYIDTF